MKSYYLTFGTINIINPQLVEIIIHENVVVTIFMLQAIKGLLLEKMQPDYNLIVNRVNNYDHTENVKAMLGSLQGVGLIGVVCPTEFSFYMQKCLAALPKNSPYVFKVFRCRAIAVNWFTTYSSQITKIKKARII